MVRPWSVPRWYRTLSFGEVYVYKTSLRKKERTLLRCCCALSCIIRTIIPNKMTMRLASTAAATVAVLASSSVGSAAAASAKNQHTVIKSGSITSNSVVGQRILAAATREDAPLNGGRALDDQNANAAFVANYSLKFQGCHEITQWNGEADGEDDVRVSTKRLVRFRLCPSDSCQDESSAGCNSGYGDYVMDMNTFLGRSWSVLKN